MMQELIDLNRRISDGYMVTIEAQGGDWCPCVRVNGRRVVCDTVESVTQHIQIGDNDKFVNIYDWGLMDTITRNFPERVVVEPSIIMADGVYADSFSKLYRRLTIRWLSNICNLLSHAPLNVTIDIDLSLSNHVGLSVFADGVLQVMSKCTSAYQAYMILDQCLINRNLKHNEVVLEHYEPWDEYFTAMETLNIEDWGITL